MARPLRHAKRRSDGLPTLAAKPPGSTAQLNSSVYPVPRPSPPWRVTAQQSGYRLIPIIDSDSLASPAPAGPARADARAPNASTFSCTHRVVSAREAQSQHITNHKSCNKVYRVGRVVVPLNSRRLHLHRRFFRYKTIKC